jgi:hypothetical protein
MSKSLAFRRELFSHVKKAKYTVTENLYEACISHWWSRCEQNEDIFALVFSALTGHTLRKSDLETAPMDFRRGFYTFTSKHSFPNDNRVYIAEIVATILLESDNKELINVYYNSLLSRLARLEHNQLQRERHFRWIQKVLAMLVRANPDLRLSDNELPMVEGEVRS